MDARKYAGVAVRKAWADLLLKLHLWTLADAAYNEALVRAAVLAEELEGVRQPAPALRTWRIESQPTRNAATGVTHDVTVRWS